MIVHSPPKPQASVLTAWTETLLRALEARDIATTSILASVGVERSELADPEARIPLATSSELWRAAVEATGDDAFGIEVSRHVTPGTFHAMGSAFLTSATLRDSLQRVARYSRITADMAVGSIESDESEFSLIIGWRDLLERPTPAALDAVLAAIVRAARTLHDREFAPIRITVERPTPANHVRFDDFFRCPITFDADENRLTFTTEDVNRPIPGGNERLATISESVLAAYLDGLEQNTLIDDLRAVLADVLPAGQPSLRAIAGEFAMSPRSMQRRLDECGTTFREVIAETRSDLATAMLANGMSVTETTHRLGFSETAAFSRAYRRWTGHSPSTRMA